MSALKRSSICRKSYTGSEGEVDLVKSLELLFYISGKAYSNKIPDFNIPSPYEFLGYARTVSDDVYDKSRKSLAIAQFYNGASKSTIQKILYARPFQPRVTKDASTTQLLEFLTFIHADQPHITSNRTLLCISTVYYAVTLYNYLQEYMDMPILWAQATQEFGTELWKMKHGKAITQFCTSHMPVLYSVRHDVRDGIAVFLNDSVNKNMELHMNLCKFESDALTGVLATATAAGIEKLLVRNPAYKKQVLQPLLRIMYDAGLRT